MKLEPEEIEAIASAVASRIAERGLSSGKRLLPNAGQDRGPAEGDQNAVSADSCIQRNMDIIAALDRGDRKCAVELWQKRQKSAGLPDTKAFLYKEAAQDKADYYRWEKGQKAASSQAERGIRRVLLKPFS